MAPNTLWIKPFEPQQLYCRNRTNGPREANFTRAVLLQTVTSERWTQITVCPTAISANSRSTVDSEAAVSNSRLS